MDLIYALAVGLFFGLAGNVLQLLRRDLIKAAMGFGMHFNWHQPVVAGGGGV
jgi:hypothetical protein